MTFPLTNVDGWCKQTLTDLRPFHGHPLWAGEGVANLSGHRSRGVGALPLLHLGELSMAVFLHAHHTAVLPATTTRHRALGPGPLLPAAQKRQGQGSLALLFHSIMNSTLFNNNRDTGDAFLKHTTYNLRS